MTLDAQRAVAFGLEQGNEREYELGNCYERMARCLLWMSRQDVPPALDDIAAALSLSPWHAQRVFSHWAGVSPKRFMQFLAKERARAALLAGADVLEASDAAGLSGPGRLHDLMVRCEAATPGDIRSGGAGLQIEYGIVTTPLGLALLARSARGVMRLGFVCDDDGEMDLAILRDTWPRASLVRDDVALAPLANQIFAGYSSPEPVHLFVKGTSFQIQVWQALLRLKPGCLSSYGDIARQIDHPAAARAVGAAVGANPIALLIPCHRVIRGDGGLGGYRWGLGRKQVMLGVEHRCDDFIN